MGRYQSEPADSFWHGMHLQALLGTALPHSHPTQPLCSVTSREDSKGPEITEGGAAPSPAAPGLAAPGASALSCSPHTSLLGAFDFSELVKKEEQGSHEPLRQGAGSNRPCPNFAQSLQLSKAVFSHFMLAAK